MNELSTEDRIQFSHGMSQLCLGFLDHSRNIVWLIHLKLLASIVVNVDPGVPQVGVVGVYGDPQLLDRNNRLLDGLSSFTENVHIQEAIIERSWNDQSLRHCVVVEFCVSPVPPIRSCAGRGNHLGNQRLQDERQTASLVATNAFQAIVLLGGDSARYPHGSRYRQDRAYGLNPCGLLASRKSTPTNKFAIHAYPLVCWGQA